MTLIDLRMHYKRLTGNNDVPISHDYFGDVKYIIWLEEELLRLMEMKQKLIPWEK
jgi:hypothetical protein